MNSIFEKIAAAVAQSKGIDVSEIKPESTFQDLGVDSLDIAELVMNLEDEFGITIELSEGIKTVADMMQLIEQEQSK